MGPHVGPDSHKPQHLNDGVSSRDHRTQASWEISHFSAPPALTPIRIQHQGASQTKARERAPPSSTTLFHSRRKIPVILTMFVVCFVFLWLERRKECEAVSILITMHSGLLFSFCSQKTKWESVLKSIAPKENIEDFCRKGWSFSWKISQAHFDQQLNIFISTKNIFCQENCSWLQFLIYVVILKKCPFELFIFSERLNIHPSN